MRIAEERMATRITMAKRTNMAKAPAQPVEVSCTLQQHNYINLRLAHVAKRYIVAEMIA